MNLLNKENLFLNLKTKTMNDNNNEYFEYLDDLRDSGVTNMFGASAYLEDEFYLGRAEARQILLEWMQRKQS